MKSDAVSERYQVFASEQAQSCSGMVGSRVADELLKILKDTKLKDTKLKEVGSSDGATLSDEFSLSGFLHQLDKR